MNNQQRDRSRIKPLWGDLLLMSTGGMVVAALLVVLGISRSGLRFFEGLNAMFNPPQPKPEVDVRSLVVTQVRSASELTTAVFAMEAVVPTRQDSTVGGYVVGTTKLLYIAYGEVKAGVDLSQIKAENVAVQGDTIQIRLPPPKILDSKIDVHRSYVYDYNRGFLGLGPDVAPQLQTKAEQETVKKIVEAACTQGLLKQASDRAQLVVTQLLSTSGYKLVSVQTTPPTSCGQSTPTQQ